ncbi:hypothetical protein [Streptacidiphilus pinicola]|nr:hypothetical protein [Streptacidiphilus pinicola]
MAKSWIRRVLGVGVLAVTLVGLGATMASAAEVTTAPKGAQASGVEVAG